MHLFTIKKIIFLSLAGALYPEEQKSYKFPETYTPSLNHFMENKNIWLKNSY